MSVRRLQPLAALLVLAACSSGGHDNPGGDGPIPQPASLTLAVPSPDAAIPSCNSPFVQLEKGGVDVGCGLGCPTASSTCTLSCPEYLGLMSATAYQLAVVYVQGSTPVASATVGDVSLSAGANQLTVNAGAVTTIDANHDGQADLVSACP